MKNSKVVYLVGIKIFIFCVTDLFAQAPNTLWTKTYGGTLTDKAWSIQQTDDGGYIIAGYTQSFGAGYEDVYLLKTDNCGDTLWARTYGGVVYDYGFSAQQTNDGGYIIAGWTWSFGLGYYDIYLIKTNSSGDTLWTNTFGSADPLDWEKGYSVQQTTDGGYIIAGCTEMGAGSYDVWLVKTNSSGDAVWTRMYGGTDDDRAWSVQQTLDGGYIIAGYTESAGTGSYDVWLIKTNSAGDTVWAKTYGGTDADYGYSVQQTADNGYIIVGKTESFGAGLNDVWLIKTNSSGDTLWTRTYGGTGTDAGHSVQQTTDGGYIIAGYTEMGAGSYDAWLIKTNSSGDTLWTQTYGGTGSDIGYAVRQTTDGGYIIAGYTSSYGVGDFDVYLIKTEPEPVGIAEEEIQIANQPFTNFGIHPNPFTSITEIRFQISDANGEVSTCPTPVTLNIYDVYGRLVKSFSPFIPHSSDINSIFWDGGDNYGRIMNSGIYYCRLTRGSFTETRMVLFMK